MKVLKVFLITLVVALLFTYFACQNNVKTAQLKWKFKINSNVRGDIVKKGNSLYFHDTHYFYSINTLTGKENWKFDTQSHSDQKPNFVITKNSIYLTDGVELKKLYRLDINNGKKIWQFNANLPSQNWVESGQIKLIDDQLHYSFDDYILLINKKTGKEIKRLRNKHLIRISKYLSYEVESQSTNEGYQDVYKIIDNNSGKTKGQLISKNISDEAPTPPIDIYFYQDKAIYNEADIVGSIDQPVIKALNLRINKTEWIFKPRIKLLNILYIKQYKDLIYIGAEYAVNNNESSGIVFALDLKTGKEMWRIIDRLNYLFIADFNDQHIVIKKSSSESQAEGIFYDPPINSLFGYDLNGRTKWNYLIDKEGLNLGAMDYGSGMVYFSLGEDDETEITGDYYIYALDI